VGDEGDGTVSCFVLRPLGGPGSPYFQSSYPCFVIQDTLQISSFVLDIIKQYLYSTTNYPHRIPIFANLFDHAMIYQWQKVIGIVPATPPPIFIFSTPTMSGSQKGSWIQTKVNMYVRAPLGARAYP